MSALHRGLTLLLVLALPLTALANGHWRRSVSSYYYYPAPVTVVPGVVPVYPAAPVYLAAPVPQETPAVPYAPPEPACPSPAPLDAPMPPASATPALRESPSSAQTTTAARVAGTVTVSFWNRSAQDVTLRVDGRSRVLARGKGLTLEMPREFVWQVNDRSEESERVPVQESGVEIVIRR